MFIKKVNNEWLFVSSCILLYTIFFSIITINRHYAFATTGGDLGLFDQSLWTTLNKGMLLFNTLEGSEIGGLSHFSIHNQPILFLLIPFYALYQNPITLLVLQSFILALGALPIYLLSRDLINQKSGYIFIILYLLYPSVHWVNLFDFHPEAFSPVLLLFTFYFLQKKDYKKYILFLILSLTIKEDIGFIAIAFGIYIFFNYFSIYNSANKKHVLLGIGAFSIMLGILWISLSMFVIIPHYNTIFGHSPFYERYAEIGINSLTNENTQKYIYEIFSPMVFLSILSPTTLAISAPIFFINILSNYKLQVSIQYHTVAAIIPFIFISTIYAVKRLTQKEIKRFNNEGNINFYLSVLLLGTLLTNLFFGAISPGTLDNNRNEIYAKQSLHDTLLLKIINMIPENASVTTQNDIFPHVSRRVNAYIDYNYNISEYVLVDLSTKWSNGTYKWSQGFRGKIKELMSNENYGIQVAVDDIFLFKKNFTGETLFVSKYGLIGKYYSNENLSGKNYIVQNLKIDFDWGYNPPLLNIPPDHNSIRWDGYIYIPKNGTYSFRLYSDDGSQLYIDDQRIMGRWGSGIYNEEQKNYLNYGIHKIKIEYVNYEGTQAIKLFWLQPGNDSFEVIQPEYFRISSEI